MQVPFTSQHYTSSGRLFVNAILRASRSPASLRVFTYTTNSLLMVYIWAAVQNVLFRARVQFLTHKCNECVNKSSTYRMSPEGKHRLYKASIPMHSALRVAANAYGV